MTHPIIDAEIARREARATQLLARYPELREAKDYVAFMRLCDEVGLDDLDFITSCSMWEQLQADRP